MACVFVYFDYQLISNVTHTPLASARDTDLGSVASDRSQSQSLPAAHSATED